MHSRAQVELRLHVGDMGKPDVDAFRLVKRSGKLVVGAKCAAPQMGEIRTAFQN